MADDLRDLAALLLENNANLADIMVSDLVKRAPLLAALPADTASASTTHEYLKEITAPTVGFRNVNAGRDMSKSVDENVTEALAILDATSLLDKAYADGHIRGAEYAIQKEALRHLQEAFQVAELQLINGQGVADAGGFEGLYDMAELSAVASETVLDAGGTTGDKTSVLMIIAGENELQTTVGNGGELSIGETVVQLVEEGATTKKFPAYVTPISSWLGLQKGSKWSVARLANIDDAGSSLDDALLSDLFEIFPENRPPTHLVMNKRSRRQLQKSRTATNATGAPAPWPTEWEGIPIISTGSLLNNEAQVV